MHISYVLLDNGVTEQCVSGGQLAWSIIQVNSFFFYKPLYMIVFTIVIGDKDKDMQKMIKDIDEYMRVCENIKKEKKKKGSRI